MKYLRWPNNNFGDNLNDLIFPRLGVHQSLAYHKSQFNQYNEQCLLGLGTLISKKINVPITVAGSGCNGTSHPKVALNYEFVRGPETAKFLGLPRYKSVGDPAYYLIGWMQAQAQQIRGHGVSIIPHMATPLYGDNVIRPELSTEEFIKRVAGSRYVLAEAMHGAVCADILRVPWCPLQISARFDHFKWHDWARSMNLEIQIDDLRHQRHFYLSSDRDLDQITTNVTHALETAIYRTARLGVVWC